MLRKDTNIHLMSWHSIPLLAAEGARTWLGRVVEIWILPSAVVPSDVSSTVALGTSGVMNSVLYSCKVWKMWKCGAKE